MTPELAKATLEYFEEYIAESAIENAIIITKEGEVYHCAGDLNGIPLKYFEGIKDKLKGAEITHNHPIGSDNEYSFSNADIYLFQRYKLARLRGIDEKFVYEIDRNAADIDETELSTTEYNYKHWDNVRKAKVYGFGYRRWSK